MVTIAGSDNRALESEETDVPPRTGAETAGLGLEIVTLLTTKRESTLGSTTVETTTMTATAEATPRVYGRQFLKKELEIRRLFSPSASDVKHTPSAEALSKNLCR